MFLLIFFLLFCQKILVISIDIDYENYNNHQHHHHHHHDCGIPYYKPQEHDIGTLIRSRRIINGMNSRPYSWPWLASFKLNSNLHHFCSGFIISKNFILTAAHCLSRVSKTDFHIVVGLHELHKYINVQILQPKVLIIHEEFDRKKKLNDIALIQLLNPVNLTIKSSIICLPNDFESDNFYNKKYYVSGWGQTVPGEKPVNSKLLKQTILNIINDTECSFKSQILCANSSINSSNICFGDSGVPLTLKRDDGRWYAYGIASFAVNQRKKVCDTQKSYFTNILYYRSWIKTKINQYRNVN